MCLLAFYYRTAPGIPLLLAANREERFGRSSLPPRLQPGRPRVACGIDQQAGGTWLGVNEHGLVVTVTNRHHVAVPKEARSRGLLCRELLNDVNAVDAADHAECELCTGRYAGANYVIADASTGWVVSCGENVERVEWQPGLHTLSNGAPDDPHDPRQDLLRNLLASIPTAALSQPDGWSQLATVFSQPPSIGAAGIVLRAADRGTVSSTLLAIADRHEESMYRYAPGTPDREPYEDFSALLRDVLRQALRRLGYR